MSIIEKLLLMIKFVKLFEKYCFLLNNALQSNQPVVADSNQMKILRITNIIQCRRLKTGKISKSSIESHLHWLGYVNHFH